jgi:hypothetical protein
VPGVFFSVLTGCMALMMVAGKFLVEGKILKIYKKYKIGIFVDISGAYLQINRTKINVQHNNIKV